ALERSQDQGERSAELVAQVGEEPGPRLVQLLQLGVLGGEFLFVALQLSGAAVDQGGELDFTLPETPHSPLKGEGAEQHEGEGEQDLRRQSLAEQRRDAQLDSRGGGDY